MSTCDILMPNSTNDSQLNASTTDGEQLRSDYDNVKSQESGKKRKAKCDSSKDNDEKEISLRIVYTKEELLELRSAPESLKRPECLSEEFYKDGVWDIEAWHRSSTSRSASPSVDGKCVTFDGGKKIELLDNAIELAPHRRSFCQGCHVQTTSESEKEREGSLKRLGGKVGLGGDPKSPLVDGRDRLTGRASLRRRTIEKSVLRENRPEPEAKRSPKTNYEQRNEEIRKEGRSYNERRDTSDHKNYRNYKERDRNERSGSFDKENRSAYNSRNGARRTESTGSLPEWMTDGPSSQMETIELKGFNDEIEQERKALQKDKKPASSNKVEENRSRRSSKGSSRSSTPGEKKQRKTSRNELNEPRHEEYSKPVITERRRTSSQRQTPTDNLFDDNAYFDVMDYLPPHLFADDYTNETNSQSKFSQWFQNERGHHSDDSRPNSVPLGFDAGFASHSPTIPSQPYFTPIQPAPPTHAFERPIPVSPLMDIFPKRRTPQDKSKEVKGRMTLKDIEPEIPKPIGQKPEKKEAETKSKFELTAFDKLVSSMKAAGQLPEKPAPVVSGLPEHLLPKPPTRTSPSFEKLKRALSRSPSPIIAGKQSPLNFINRPTVSPLTAPTAERLLSPEFFKQPLKQRSMSPGSFFSGFNDGIPLQKGGMRPQPKPNNQHGDQRIAMMNHHRHHGPDPGLQTPDSFTSSKHQANQSRVPAAFLPTAVIKKMHSEKQDVRDKPHLFDNDDDDLIAKLDFTNATLGSFDTPHNNKDMGPLLHHNNNDIASRNIPESQNPHRLFGSLLDEKLNINGRGDTLMSNHNPKGMDNISQTSLLEHKDQLGGRGPFPPYQKDFGPPGSNVPPISSKVVGSGSAYPRMQDDFAGGARSGFDLQTDMLARAPHRGDVFAGHQGRPNSGMGNDGRLNIGEVRARNQGPNMAPRAPFNPNLLQNGAQKNPINFPPHGQMPSRPPLQQQQQPRFNPILRGRVPLPQNNSRLPVPMNPPTSLNNLPFSRPNVPAATAVMAAQIMQQQLLQHAARAQALQAAQAIHQQQQQNLLRTQMQAAMAQAYVRGHAAKAMMYNPRAVASSLQAVAQQMGLRAPQPQGKPGTSIPASMMNQLKPEEAKQFDEGNKNEEQQKPKESPLSKWFNVETIKKAPANAQHDPSAQAKFISVEDLERSHK